jgi:hypothetical protein
MAVAVATVITMGGSDDVTGVAAPAREDASTTPARFVTMSILSAIDGCDRQKFDVRNRDKCTA